MKKLKGKKYKLNVDNRFTIEYGCDSIIKKKITSFYVTLSTWMMPTEQLTLRQLSLIHKTIKQNIYNVPSALYLRDRTITDFTYPVRHVDTDKKMFINFEAVAFVENTTMTNPAIKVAAEGMAREIIKGLASDEINFSISKK